MVNSNLRISLQTVYSRVKRPLYAGTTLVVSSALIWRLHTAPFTFILVAVMLGCAMLSIQTIQRVPQCKRWLVPLTIVALVLLLAVTKYLSTEGFVLIGISYLAFRLIHAVVDSSRLPILRVDDFITYALFPPALIAGPIHRIKPFLQQLDTPRNASSEAEFLQYLTRIGVGLVKKFVLASAFGLIALNQIIATNRYLTRLELITSLLAYGFMLYFDFSGYTDMALGVAGLIGFKLPENFNNPYAQPNLARFWQTWHMSLSFWFRDYVFFPLSRTLLQRSHGQYTQISMVIANVTTMTLIGLWHGLTVGFVLWGLWHGFGLSFYTLWSSFSRQHDWRIPTWCGVILTFCFVMAGWSFFALSDIETIGIFWSRLLGQ